jgi:hypothetical protein
VTTHRPVLVVASAALVVFGAFQAVTAYGSWSSWLIAVLALGAGALGWARLVRRPTERSESARSLAWLVPIAALMLLAVAGIESVAVVCGGESGFSCGG